MSDPRRLFEEGGDLLELTLLKAGMEDGPSRRTVRKTAAALGIAGATVAAATGVASGATATSIPLTLKLLGIGALAAAVAVGAAQAVHVPSPGQAVPVPKTTPSATMVRLPADVPKATGETAPLPTNLPLRRRRLRLRSFPSRSLGLLQSARPLARARSSLPRPRLSMRRAPPSAPVDRRTRSIPSMRIRKAIPVARSSRRPWSCASRRSLSSGTCLRHGPWPTPS